MIEEACTCDGLPAHDHGTIVGWTSECGPDGVVRTVVRRDPDHIHLWVDWKAVARALMTEEKDEQPHDPSQGR